ncbi:MAG TPA: DMT family transporter [Methylotenera sp.]|nr:DMT family transporter [Methylotenera sp.]
MINSNKNGLAIFGLLFGAFCWGIIWYPYRLMAEAGVSGVASSFYTYCIAALLAGTYFSKYLVGLFRTNWRTPLKPPQNMVWIGLVAGWTNLSYVLAVIDGEVMRVMLLFYLSPLWTLLLARFWLKEPITKIGFISITIALFGAYIMLAGPFSEVESRLPVPRNSAEWLALSAGIGFSLTNVITRKSSQLNLLQKSFSVWLGVIFVAALSAPFLGHYYGQNFVAPSFFSLNNWLIMLIIALLLIAATMLVQFGVTQLTAIRASVLFLFELVVAAIASYYLAHEAMTLNEWLGGLLIIAAALTAALNHKD